MADDETKLTPEELSLFLSRHPGWSVQGAALVKTYRFDSFPSAVGFINRLAQVAEAHNHHPDIDLRYRDVTLRLSTHSAGGLTFRDPKLAEAADGLETAP